MAIQWDSGSDEVREQMEIPAPGKCHLALTEFEEYGEKKNGSHIATFEILAHDKPSEVGKVFKEFFSSKPTAFWRLRVLAVALGMYTVEQFREAKESGKALELDFPAAANRQLMAVIEHSDKGYAQIGVKGGGMYELSDGRCADWPRHEAMAARQASNKPQRETASTGSETSAFGF